MKKSHHVSSSALHLSIAVINLFFCLNAFAQAPNNGESLLQVKEQSELSANAAKRQIPTDNEAIKAQDSFLKENVPAAPLPAASPNLDTLRSRAANLQQKQTAYLQNLAAGKTAPFPEIRKNWPQFQATVKGLQTDLQSLDAEKDPAKRAELSKTLFAALQPIGFLLEGADYDENFTGRLTTAKPTNSILWPKNGRPRLPPLI